MSVNAIQAPIVRAAGIGAPPTSTVAQALAAFRANSITTPVTISDTVDNVKNNFDFLTQLGSKLGGLRLSNGNNQNTPLTLTSSQYTSGTSVLNSIKTAFSLKVTNVSTDDLNSVLSNAKVLKVEVSDTTAKIGLNFDRLLTQPGRIDKVTQTGALTDISITEAQKTNAGSLGMLAKIKDSNNANNYSLALTNVKASSAAGLVTNAANKVSTVDVKDTAANIATSVAQLATITPAKLLGISQSDAASTIQLDYTTYNSNKTGVLLKLAGNSNLSVTNVKADQATVDAVNADAKVKGISITDTAQAVLDGKTHNNGLAKVTATNVVDTSANISAKFGTTTTLLAGMSGLTKVTIKDTGAAGALSITEDQFKNNSALLAKLYVDGNANKNAYTIAVKDVVAADAAALAKTSTISKITVKSSITDALSSFTALSSNTKVNQIDLTGSSADIGTNIDAMDKLGAKLNTITNNSVGTNITVSYDQFVKRSATLAKIDSYGLKVTDVSASAARNLSTDATRYVNELTVKDSGANISTSFTDLKNTVADGKLSKIVQSDTAEVKLTAAQHALATGAGGLLSKLKDSTGTGTAFKLHITEALAANVNTLSGTNNVTKVSIKDTSANISASIGLLSSVSQAGELGDVYQSGTQANIGISATQLANANTKAVLEKVYGTNNVKGNYTLDVTGVLAADAKALETANSKVAKITISDTAANLAANLGTVSTINASKLKSLTVTGGDIDVQASNLVSYTTSVFSKIDGGNYTLNVKDADATQAKTLTSTNSKIAHMTVLASGTSVAAKWGDLNDLFDSAKLTKITLSDADTPLILTNDQYDNGQASSLGNHLNEGNYKLSISGVSAADAADSTKSVNTDSHVASMSVKDLGANIGNNLSSLDALGGKLLSINWTDTQSGGVDQIMATITASDYQSYIGTLAKVNGGVYSADVNGLAAADAAAAGADTNVHAFTVSDTAANLGKYFDDLTTLATTAATAADGTGVTDITQTGAGDISITKTQYDAGTDAMALLTANSLTFAVTDVEVADAATIAGDANVNKISVKDTAANFAADLDDSDAGTTGNLTTNVAKLDKVTLSDTSAFTITGFQYNENTDVLGKIEGTYQATITSLAAGDVTTATGDANVVHFDVLDTAANIGSNFASLVANDKLTSIAQSDSDPVPLALTDLVGDPAGYAATLQKFATPPSIALS